MKAPLRGAGVQDRTRFACRDRHEKKHRDEQQTMTNQTFTSPRPAQEYDVGPPSRPTCCNTLNGRRLTHIRPSKNVRAHRSWRTGSSGLPSLLGRGKGWGYEHGAPRKQPHPQPLPNGEGSLHILAEITDHKRRCADALQSSFGAAGTFPNFPQLLPTFANFTPTSPQLHPNFTPTFLNFETCEKPYRRGAEKRGVRPRVDIFGFKTKNNPSPRSLCASLRLRGYSQLL